MHKDDIWHYGYEVNNQAMYALMLKDQINLYESNEKSEIKEKAI